MTTKCKSTYATSDLEVSNLEGSVTVTADPIWKLFLVSPWYYSTVYIHFYFFIFLFFFIIHYCVLQSGLLYIVLNVLITCLFTVSPVGGTITTFVLLLQSCEWLSLYIVWCWMVMWETFSPSLRTLKEFGNMAVWALECVHLSLKGLILAFSYPIALSC